MDLELQTDDEEKNDNTSEEETSNISSLVEKLSTHILEIIDEFYNTPYYKGDKDFIENIVLFNSGLIDAPLKISLKDELMLEIYSRDIVIPDVMADINKSMIWGK
jgi:hypothetical protein